VAVSAVSAEDRPAEAAPVAAGDLSLISDFVSIEY
jgi:hypothetical protein